MRPEKFRNRWGFAALQAAPVAFLASTPAWAAPVAADQVLDAAPLAVTLGAIGFGLVATLLLRRARREGREAIESAHQQLAQMRADLDLTTGVLAGMPDLTVLWTEAGAPPRIFGQTSMVLDELADSEAIMDFRTWLPPEHGAPLARAIVGLKTEARPFDMSVFTLGGKLIRISGRAISGAAVLRIRPATAQPRDQQQPAAFADPASVEAVFDLLPEPAWLRDGKGALARVNQAYRELAGRISGNAADGKDTELFDASARDAQLSRLTGSDGVLTFANVLHESGAFDMVLFATNGGSAGFLKERREVKTAVGITAGLERNAGIIDAIATPIAIFDANRRLRHFNKAYAEFWDLDEDWLKSGVDEGAILDRLRTQGQLPSEADYRAWRARHLSSYNLKASREEPWYLPDGRTLNVVSVPAAGHDGVIYIFENITEQLALESRYNALIDVQSETLGALSEAVAVFGTNGRLTLSNPRLSMLWKLPMNELGQHPHIDQIAEACARAMPEDGAIVWRDLKQNIVDLNPSRSDRSGRINRADGRLVDYAVTRLPDGQTMMTFADVTESANFQRVLKERNDALVTADRLKDAFVQNVSYELRSPLTNIIGFADLLASGTAGALNEKQKSYTDYIRTSSQTLGVLIDNILDLANVDAGIAELRLEEQDVRKLVERARAGLAGTMAGGETPVNLRIDLAANLPAFVADGTRIVQVLYNLLSNAVRFSDPGAEVRLSVSGRADRLVFVVEDEGVGISEDMKAAMFQRFEGQSVEGRQRGPGLGLAIVKTFVSLHGGTISIERREPKGTRVIVSIPAKPAVATNAAE